MQVYPPQADNVNAFPIFSPNNADSNSSAVPTAAQITREQTLSAEVKPAAFPVNAGAIPESLRVLWAWVNWEWRDWRYSKDEETGEWKKVQLERWTKAPLSPVGLKNNDVNVTQATPGSKGDWRKWPFRAAVGLPRRRW